MTVAPQKEKVLILVKALPQPSKQHGETVCCAGVTPQGEWRRLFPVRFRHLTGENTFARWDWLTFRFRRPTVDGRAESCHVFEDSIEVVGSLPNKRRARLLDPLLIGSGKQAAELGRSLALIRPRNTKFIYKQKSAAKIEADRDAFRRAARQTLMFDKELAELEPSPYEFRFKFDDDAGAHNYECGDWECHAMFFIHRKRTSEVEALRWMNETFNEKYPAKGMAFAIGNQAKRPQTWQLLGVIRLDNLVQGELAF